MQKLLSAKVIILAGSGQSIDLLPEKIIKENAIISLNWAFIYVPENHNRHICFCSDHTKERFKEIIETTLYKAPCILSKYDFKPNNHYTLSKDLNVISSAPNSFFRGLDLCYKLNPEIILLAGIDLCGKQGKKIDCGLTGAINYNHPGLEPIIKRDVEAYLKAKKQIESEGIKVINISPVSKLPQDMTIEEFVNEYS